MWMLLSKNRKRHETRARAQNSYLLGQWAGDEVITAEASLIAFGLSSKQKGQANAPNPI
jgi:hypothetical protein